MGGSVVESGCVAILINPSFSSTSNNGSRKKRNVKKREHVRTTSNEGGGREREREKWIEPKVSAAEWRLRSPDKAEPIETEQEGQQRANVLIFSPFSVSFSSSFFESCKIPSCASCRPELLGVKSLFHPLLHIHMERRRRLLLFWLFISTVVLQSPDGVRSCYLGTFAESLPRTVNWPSASTFLDPWRQIVPFFFHPPEFLDRWAKADFALLHASLSLPCSILQHQPEVVLLPEAWIEFLPALEDGARYAAVDQQPARPYFDMCDLFGASNISRDSVPGCQNWHHPEAWKRLRIFYDIPSPIRAAEAATAHRLQCGESENYSNSNSTSDGGGGSNSTWTIPVSSMVKRWMAERSPWTRSNATMPIAIVSRHQSFYGRHHSLLSVQAELHLTYWMDSE